MKIYRGFDELPQLNYTVATVGSFDGVHRGHIELLENLTTIAKLNGGESVVLTFEPHPRVVLGRSEGLNLLMSFDEKVRTLRRYGVENLVVIPFDKSFSRLSHSQFIKEYLVGKLNLRSLVVGYDHNMGCDSDGLYGDFVKLGEECGFDVSRVPECMDIGGMHISSTFIRNVIRRGEMERAAELLSRPYMIMGSVDNDGRVWFNEPLKLLPAAGIYMARINMDCEAVVEVDSNGAIWLKGGFDRNHGDEKVTIELPKSRGVF
ncbi:MAG: FAD synthetase [Rikenellaceae bacterium]